MEPNELRIGNLFTTHVPLTGSWAERQRFRGEIYQANFQTFRDPESFKYFCGIPLDEKEMHRLGMTRVNAGRWVHRQYTGFVLDENKGMGIYHGHSIAGQSLKYVHQFQNLFFALCGVEAEYKL